MPIQLGMDKAVEFRTFQLQSIAGLDRTLRSAYLLGAALRASQDISYGNPLREGMHEETRDELAGIWSDFSEKFSGIVIKYGLNPEVWQWREPSNYHDEHERKNNDFVPFANLLNEAQKDPESKGAKFVHEMRGLVISTNAKIAKIVYA